MGGRACPAYVGVGQEAKRQHMKVEVGEESWNCEIHTVYCRAGFEGEDMKDGQGG